MEQDRVANRREAPSWPRVSSAILRCLRTMAFLYFGKKRPGKRAD
jgi:hypothetical protein